MASPQAQRSKRWVWHKIHPGNAEETLQIRAVEVTTHNVGGAPMLLELLGQIGSNQMVATVTADSAYDTRKCHDTVAERGAAAIIPPHRNAKPLEADHRRSNSTKRGAASLALSRPGDLATLEQVSPAKSCGDEEELYEGPRSAPHGAQLRSKSRRGSDPRCRPERLHRSWHTHHDFCRLSVRGNGAVAQSVGFAQQHTTEQ